MLTTAYYTLLSATLATWSSKQTLTHEAFVAFVQSVLDGLPSSSSVSTGSSSHAAIFGEIITDMMWSVDAELEEIAGEAKAVVANCGDQSGLSCVKTEETQNVDSNLRSRFFQGNESEAECRKRQGNSCHHREEAFGELESLSHRLSHTALCR